MSDNQCVYAERSEEAFVLVDNNLRPIEGPMLCGWADAVASEKLVDAPRWLTRAALAGHLLDYPNDCVGCPCFKARP